MNTITAEQQFEILPYDLEAIGAHGGGRIEVQVHGYWSEVASLYINRQSSWRDDGAVHSWSFSMTHSSGGRESEQQQDDTIAEACFAHAILGLAQLAKQLREGSVHVLEEAYQAEQYRRKQEREAKEADRRNAFANDLPLGEAKARLIVAQLELTAEETPYRLHSRVVLIPRGEEAGQYAGAIFKERVSFRLSNAPISRKNLIKQLAEASSRSFFVTP